MSIPEGFRFIDKGNECSSTSITFGNPSTQRQKDKEIKPIGYSTCQCFGLQRSSGNSCCHKYFCQVLHLGVGNSREFFQPQERTQYTKYPICMSIPCGTEEVALDENGCTTIQKSLFNLTTGTKKVQNQLAIFTTACLSMPTPQEDKRKQTE